MSENKDKKNKNVDPFSHLSWSSGQPVSWGAKKKQPTKPAGKGGTVIAPPTPTTPSVKSPDDKDARLFPEPRDPTAEVPTTPDPDPNVKPEPPMPDPASNEEVLEWVYGDLSKPRGDDVCWANFQENMWWYAGFGGFAALTLWPIVAPLNPWSIPSRTKRFINDIRKTREILKQSGSIAPGSRALLRTTTGRVWGYLVNIFGGVPKGFNKTLKAAGGSLGNLFNTMADRNLATLASQSRGFAGNVAGGIKGLAIGVKGLSTTLAALAIIIAFFRGGGNDEETRNRIGTMETWQDFVIGFLDATLLTEAAMEIMLISAAKAANEDIEDKCFVENTLRATAVLLLVYSVTGGAAATAAAPAAAAGLPARFRRFYDNDLTQSTSSPDRLLAQTRSFWGSQIKILDEQIEIAIFKAIDEQSTLRNVFKRKLNEPQQLEYISKLLGGGPKAGEGYLASLGLEEKLVKQIHSASVSAANETSRQFIKNYKSDIRALEQMTGKGSKLRQQSQAAQSERARLLNHLQEGVRNLNKGTAGSSKLLSASSLAKADGQLLAMKSVSGDIRSLSKLLDDTDAMLYAGADPVKIVGLYRNNILPAMDDVSANLDIIIRTKLGNRLGKLKNSSDPKKITDAFIANLSTINKTSKKGDFFEELINATGGQSLFSTMFRRNKKLLKAQLSARQISDILGAQVLKANSNIRPSDIARLEKQLLIFQKNVSATIIKKWKIPGFDISYDRNKLLFFSAATTAVSSALIYYIFRQSTIEEVEIDDVSTWRGCNLARALIWEKYGDSVIAKAHKYFNGVPKTYAPQYAVDSESNSMRALYEYLYKDEYGPILSSFLTKYVFNGNFLEKDLSSLSFMQDRFEGKNAQDFTEQFINDFVHDFAKHLAKKTNLQKLLDAFGASKGSQLEAGQTYESESSINYRNTYFPIFIKLLVYNSNIVAKLRRYRDSNLRGFYNELSRNERIAVLLGSTARAEANAQEIIRNSKFEKYADRFRSFSIFTFSLNSYKELGKKCIENEMTRKVEYISDSQTKTNLSFLGKNYEVLNQGKKGYIDRAEFFVDRIFYSLKPGEFYGKEEEEKVNAPTNQEIKDNLDAEKKKPTKPSDPNERYRNLNFENMQKLSMYQAYLLLKKHEPLGKKDLYDEDDIIKLAAITGPALESSGLVRAFNPRKSGEDRSYGLWQINMYGSLSADRLERWKSFISKEEDLYNPDNNAKAAWDLFLLGARIIKNNPNRGGRYKGSNKFGAWSVTHKHKKGGVKHRKWLKFYEVLKKEIQEKESVKMDENNLKDLVKGIIKENYGKGYTPYPYHSHIGQDQEPAEDFIQDWKDFELSLVRDESRETAIRVAKVLIRDLELFGDVLDLVGKNQSVATEILKYLRKNEENS